MSSDFGLGFNRMLQICMMSLSFKVFCPKKQEFSSLCSQGNCAFVLEYSHCFKADSRCHLETQAGFSATAYLSACRFCRHKLEASFYTEKGLSISPAMPAVRTITTLGMTHLHHRQAKLEFLRRVSLTARGITVNIWPHQRS